MAQVSRATFASNLATKINDNTSGDVSPADARETFADLEDSVLWHDELSPASAVVALSAGTVAGEDLLLAVDDPSGTPASTKYTVTGLSDYLAAETKTYTNKTITAPVIGGAAQFTGAPDFSGISNASTVRSDLGLEIGTNVQTYDADLTAIAALLPLNANGLITYHTGAYQEMTITPFCRGFLVATDEANFKDILNLEGALDFDATVFVAEVGNDANDGTKNNAPKLTFASAITAAEALITGGATGVRIEVLDGGSYTEASAITVPENVHIVAPAATYSGAVTISALASFDIGTHYATADGQRMANRNFTSDGPSFYRAKISDGRGAAGTFTNTQNVSNTAGAAKNFFIDVGIMYVTSNGEGLQDDSDGSGGHIHFRIGDIYLAGGSAKGIRAGSATSNIIGYVDHILEIGSPLNTIGIHVLNAGAVVKVTAAEIVADTAYQVASGDLYLNCQKITGTQTGTPANLMLGTADVGTTIQAYRAALLSSPASDPTGVTGADAVTNIMSLTQAEYDAITPNASTLYVITD